MMKADITTETSETLGEYVDMVGILVNEGCTNITWYNFIEVYEIIKHLLLLSTKVTH